MASRWSSEQVVAEYGQAHAHAMAVDCSGKLALLAGRRQLYLIDLDQPKEALSKSQRQSKWDISSVQWHPFTSHSQLFVTACNQRADICLWQDSTCKEQGSLKGHTRVISDLDWSPHDPNKLATCSVDTFTYVWDIRDYRKPSAPLQAVASVSQVKWNKVNDNLLATTHDGDIRIWDTRKGTSPVIYIAAHPSKIHGLDWCPTSEFHVASSSQDCTVKVWNITNPRQADSKLHSELPVWRARYTPFGKGLITVMVPQLRRGENSLCLWHMEDFKQPIHTFVGHTDVVLEFHWRKKEEQCPDYQLVTWSKDQSLRIWKIDPQLQKLCGENILEEAESPVEPSYMETASMMSEPYSMASVVTVVTPAEDSNKENEKPKQQAAVNNPQSLPMDIANANKSDAVDGNHVSAKQKVESAPGMTTPPSGLMPGYRRDEIHSPQQPKTLHQELELVNIDIPWVSVEEMDAFRRKVTVSAVRGKSRVKLTMTFPDSYPVNVAPNFTLNKSTTINKDSQKKLIKVLRDTSAQQVKFNRSCIEPCIRQLVQELSDLTKEDAAIEGSEYSSEVSRLPPAPQFTGIYSFGTFQDDSVPFPRTSGARFCGPGLLVSFTRKAGEVGAPRRSSSTSDVNTPRALSALTQYSQGHHPSSVLKPQASSLTYSSYYLGRSPPTDKTISDFYFNFKERSVSKRSHRSKSRLKDLRPENKDWSSSPKKQLKTGPVIIYNMDCLLPVHRQLAENYIIDQPDAVELCKHNASAALAVGRKDLAQMWSLVALSKNRELVQDEGPDMGPPWAFHPFGSKMLKSLLEHYSRLGDVQTIAMLCCVFGHKNKSIPRPAPPAAPPSPKPLTTEHTVIQTKKKFLIKKKKVPTATLR